MPSRPFVPVVMDCLSLCPVASPVVRLFLLDVHSFRRTLKMIMPRAGGESNKLGNRYEGWWTVHNLIDVLSNVVVALPPEAYIEAVGVEFAKTLRDNSGEFHPVKRQHAGSGWTLYQLASMDERGRLVLKNLFDKLDAGIRTLLAELFIGVVMIQLKTRFILVRRGVQIACGRRGGGRRFLVRLLA